jgi:hypothetical protein
VIAALFGTDLLHQSPNAVHPLQVANPPSSRPSSSGRSW